MKDYDSYILEFSFGGVEVMFDVAGGAAAAGPGVGLSQAGAVQAAFLLWRPFLLHLILANQMPSS